MAGTTTVNAIPYPSSGDGNNVPADMLAMANLLDGGSFAKRLSQAQITALTSGQKPAGLLVYNQTANQLQMSDGTNFVAVINSTPQAATPYTPTITGFTQGNGTVTGKWQHLRDKTYKVDATFTLGSTSAAAASYIGFSLPSGLTAVSTDIIPASGYLTDASSGLTYSSFARLVSTSVIGLFLNGGTNGQLLNFSTTLPFTWTTSDKAMVSAIVEVA